MDELFDSLSKLLLTISTFISSISVLINAIAKLKKEKRKAAKLRGNNKD